MGEMEKIEFLKPYLSKLPQYIVFSKKRNLQNLANKFANEAISFRKTKDFKELRLKYNL